MKKSPLFYRGGGVYCCKPNTESIGHPALPVGRQVFAFSLFISKVQCFNVINKSGFGMIAVTAIIWYAWCNQLEISFGSIVQVISCL
jgi:hypothetical protein